MRCFNSQTRRQPSKTPSPILHTVSSSRPSLLDSQLPRVPRVQSGLNRRPAGPGHAVGSAAAPPPAAVVPQDGTRGTCPLRCPRPAGFRPAQDRGSPAGPSEAAGGTARPSRGRGSDEPGPRPGRGAVGARGPGRLPACCAGSRSC